MKGTIGTLQLNKVKNGMFYFSIFIVAVMVFLFLGRLDYYLIDDSETYMNLSSGMEGVMPVYPFFLYGNKLLFGEDIYLNAVVAEQSIFAAVCVMVFIHAVKKQFRLNYRESYVCFLFSLLTFTADMPDVMTSRVILTEGIAYAAFYLFMAVLLQAIWRKSWKWLGILCLVTLFMSSIRSQLQILFGVCGAACIYIALLRKRTGSSREKIPLRFLLGTIGGLIIGLAGIWATSQIAGRYQIAMSEMRERQEIAEAIETEETENSESAAEQISVETENQEGSEERETEQWGAARQYVSLIFNKGMYEADYEDYQLFEDEQIRDLYLRLYKRIDEAGYRYPYAKPGLWMWKDITGSASIGTECLFEEQYYYKEHPELLSNSNYLAVRNHTWTIMGITLIKAHPGRFLYHAVMLLPQAFVSTVFFQVERIYLLCHLITLFLYISAIALMIWAYADKKIERAYGELMGSVLVTNCILVVVISMVFFGQKRYLFYNFGIFYVSYFLLLLQLWKHYARNFIRRKLKNGNTQKASIREQESGEQT